MKDSPYLPVVMAAPPCDPTTSLPTLLPEYHSSSIRIVERGLRTEADPNSSEATRKGRTKLYRLDGYRQ